MIRFLLTGLLFGGLLLITSSASAQPSAEMRAKMEAAKAAGGGPPGHPPGQGPNSDSKGSQDKEDSEGGDKKGGEEGSDEKSGAPEVVKRPEDPGFTVDPSELDVKPVNGMVRFNFHGQPWQGVLEWLAAISGMSLDWQQLPGDYLNLRTQRAYTIPETRDLINQHLLARGYTLLRHGNVLRVVKLSELQPALVPHVSADKLDERDPHEFVKTIFELDWIPAATAEKELKPLLSPHGELTKLSSTNRLHAMDAVTNLITIRDLLAEEQSGQGTTRLVRPFPLEYARAEDVKKALEDLLGIEQSGGSGGGNMDPRQRQMMQQMQQRMRQMQQRGGNKGGAPAQPEEKASIIANPRKNEIIATAPPETMQIIEQTVELLDAPPQYDASFQTRLRRLKAYRLDQLDAKTFTEMLRDLGGISPTTTITTDEENNAIIVNGQLADHLVVQQVIEKLDGSQRTFKVIPLRRLPAAYVAGTIRLMMGTVAEEEDNNDRYSSWWGGDNDEEDDSSGQFRVEADTANNRLLIKATEVEMEEIHNLLVQLGEIRPADQARSNTRVLNLTPEQADVFLKRLQEYWPADATNPLRIDPELRSGSDTSDSGDDQEPIPSEERAVPAGGPLRAGSPTTFPIDGTTGFPASNRITGLRLVAEETIAVTTFQDGLGADRTSQPAPLEGADVAPGNGAELNETPGQAADPFTPKQRPGVGEAGGGDEPAPVIIKRAPGGGLMIQSEDPAALNAIEDLMYELAPEPKSYHVFPLKYPTTVPFYVVLNLETFFGVYEEEENDGYRGYYYYRYGQDEQEADPLSLGQRGELTFIPDADSHTIIVQHATLEQLKTIEELIAIYDQPPARNPGDVRITRIFNLERAKAKNVAEAIKAVYRDLLSANDAAFQQGRRGGEQRGQERRGGYYSYMRNNEEDSGEPEAPITFKGLLSIGIDETSNTLIVSASQRIIEQVTLLIETLDEAASGEKSMSVVRTGGGGLPPNLANQLKEIFGEKISINGSGGGEEAEREASAEGAEYKTISPQFEGRAGLP